ncbi:hypothetical protein ABGB12_21210 [Actinocorallia sp. B10E7]|uniref:hypothetical protein n=1 Tax=Actinocorallia sp. B10E7 TaxID=3153558 RepID=UPI00325E193E
MKVDKIEDKDLPETGEEEAAEETDGRLSPSGDEEAPAEGSEKTGDSEDSEKAEDSEDSEDSEAAGESADSEEVAGSGDAEETGADEAAEPKKSGKPKAEATKAGKSGSVGLKKARGSGKSLKPAKVRTGAPLWSVVVMAVLVVGLAVGTFLLRAGSGETLSRDEVDKALRTAAATAQHISSWDYRTIESDTKQVLGETTGDFREAYEKSAAKLLESAPEQQAVTVGLTSKAGVVSVSKGQVKVLVFLNQQTVKKDAEAHIEQHRLQLTMVQKDGEWLVSKLDILG